MTLQDLLDRLRIERLDDATTQPLWSDGELVNFINDAVRQVCLRQRALTESQNPAICSYAIVPGQRLVLLHTSILAVRSARYIPLDVPEAQAPWPTQTLSTFVIAAVGLTQAVTVIDITSFVVGAYCFVGDGTNTIIGQVTSLNLTTATITTTLIAAGAAGNVMAAGAVVSIAGGSAPPMFPLFDENAIWHHPLLGTTAKRLWKIRPHWDMEPPGRCRWWMPDYQEGYLALARAPLLAGTLSLLVWRKPLESEELSLDDPDAEPVISETYHEYLLDWAEHRAYNKKDAETLDGQKSADARARFTEEVGRLPSATEIRMWGISRIVGTTTETL